MADSNPLLHIEVVYAPAARQILARTLHMPQGSSLQQALQAVAPVAGWEPLQAWLGQGADPEMPHALSVSIWNRKATLQQPLRQHDRIEICRGLLVDPKVARRERFQKQGSKAAGLFARRRAGAKPGY